MHPLQSTGKAHHVVRTKASMPLAKTCRKGALGALAILIIMSQTVPALSQQPQQQKQPEVQKGFIAPLPRDAPTGINPEERRCFARPSCPTGYRTFCVNPAAASPKCCHQWRSCEVILR
jgi:hypothetical protein